MQELNTSVTYQEKSLIFKANFYVILSGTLYGFLGFLGTTVIHTNISISNMLFWRFLIAGCWLSIFTIKQNYSKSAVTKLNLQALFSMFALGAVGYSGASGFYFVACRYTGTGLAMVIFFSYPILILLFNWLVQGKKISLATILTVAALVVGLYLLQDSKKDALSFVGIFWSILAAISYAIYVIGSKKYSMQKIDSSTLAMMVCFGCTFICMIFAIATHSLVFPSSMHDWVLLLALGVFVTAVPIQLMLKGLEHVSSMRASIISVLEPLVTLLVGVVVLHEAVSTLQLIGAAIILAGTMLTPFQRE